MEVLMGQGNQATQARAFAKANECSLEAAAVVKDGKYMPGESGPGRSVYKFPDGSQIEINE